MQPEFLFQPSTFESYSLEHGLPLLITLIFGIYVILTGKRKSNFEAKRQLILKVSLLPLLAYVLSLFFRTLEGSINLQEDLPLYICRVMAVTTPLIIYTNNRYWLGIIYFWILAGTLNANITPDVAHGFPHWSYWNYWIVHTVLIIIPIYYVLVLDLKIRFKDLINAFIMSNVFVVVTLILNKLIDANYMYTMHKPPGGSILDFFGPWPIYLITGQLLGLGLFLIIYLPFRFSKPIRSDKKSGNRTA